MENKYYVYCYYDKDWIPFYIGMGHGTRVFDHLKIRNHKSSGCPYFYNKLNLTIKNREEFHYEILREHLSRNEAFIVEQVLIKCIGRRNLNLGPLTNLTNGGDGQIGGGNLTAIYDKDSLALVRTFSSRKECASFLNVKSASVATAEREKSKTGRPNKYYVSQCKNGNPPNLFSGLKTPQAISVFAYNDITGEELKFKSIKECARYFNVDKTTISARLNKEMLRSIRRFDLKNWRFLHDK